MLVNASIFNGFQYRRIQGFTRVSPLNLLLKLGHLQSERSVKRSQRSKRNVPNATLPFALPLGDGVLLPYCVLITSSRSRRNFDAFRILLPEICLVRLWVGVSVLETAGRAVF